MKHHTLNTGRYQRQLILKEIGRDGQLKLLNSKVLVVGAGGLGCAALQYLAASGIGRIGIIDDDKVSMDNLHRQVLYSVHDIGFKKSIQAKAHLEQLNPEIEIEAYTDRLTVTNALSLISDYDIVLDCTDNFASRYLINDACVLLKKPIIYGAVSQHEGQIAILNCHSEFQVDPVNYRDLFPDPPHQNEVLNCEEAGVLGVLPGIIGVMQASECIKLIVGFGKPLVNILFNYNYLSNQFYEIYLSKNKIAHLNSPSSAEEFRQMNYEVLCEATDSEFEISGLQFAVLIKNNSTILVDVREPEELPVLDKIQFINIPLSQIKERANEITGETVVLFCQTGKRSLLAARQLNTILGPAKLIYSYKGDITSLLQFINGEAI
jgi:adenylyltransferase/sulfurtransferase